MNKKMIAGITVAALALGGYTYFKVITSTTWLRTTALLDKTVNVEQAYNIKTKGWDARAYEYRSPSNPDKLCVVVFGTDISGVGVGCFDSPK